MVIRLLLASVAVLLFTYPALANFTGPVVSVLDKAFATRAKQAASAFVFRKDVSLQTHGQDKYHRTLADVFLRDGTHVNHELVKDGWCWWYRKYASGDRELEKLEKEARDAKKGLWVDPQPVPPWVYRKAWRR